MKCIELIFNIKFQLLSTSKLVFNEIEKKKMITPEKERKNVYFNCYGNKPCLK